MIYFIDFESALLIEQSEASDSETSFTVKDIQRAIAEEERLGPRSVPCTIDYSPCPVPTIYH